MSTYYTWNGFVCGECDGINIDGVSYSSDQILGIINNSLPNGHVILEQADYDLFRVAQTVRIDETGEEYERIVHAEEAYHD